MMLLMIYGEVKLHWKLPQEAVRSGLQLVVQVILPPAATAVTVLMTYGNLIPMLRKLITIKYSPIALLLLLCSCYAKQDAEIPAAKQDEYRSLAVQQDGKDTG